MKKQLIVTREDLLPSAGRVTNIKLRPKHFNVRQELVDAADEMVFLTGEQKNAPYYLKIKGTSIADMEAKNRAANHARQDGEGGYLNI